MTKLKILLKFFVLTIVCISCNSDYKSEAVETKTEVTDGISTSTFKVWGNCGMCKNTIESALKVDGIKEANWNVDTKKMTISYDSAIISLDQIQKYIAGAGYDTEKYKGIDTVYSNLHECCKYDRK